MAPQDLRVSEEELALVHDKLMDAARKRLAGETAIRVQKILEGLDPGDFVVIAAPRDVEEPFYLAQVYMCVLRSCVTATVHNAVLFSNCSYSEQVVHNDFHHDKMTVHWYQPTARSRERTTKYHQHTFEEENEQIHSRNRQNGAARIRLQPRIQDIEYEVVHFGFNKLSKTNCLSPEVLRQLRQLGLINDRVKRH
jgi:hypothetical protein